MPKGASDGSFYRGGSFLIFGPPARFCEFHISEVDFQKYITTQDIKLSEIKEPDYILRYISQFVSDSHYAISEGNATVMDTAGYDAARGVTVTNGLFYLHAPKDDDASEHYVYDRHTKTAYIEIHTR